MSFFGPEEQKALDKQRDDPNYVPPDLSPGELQSIENKRKALVQLFTGDDIVATYKIELNFGYRRSAFDQHFPGALVMFLSGSALSGGGDQIVYPCYYDDCPGIMLPKYFNNLNTKAYCPVCKRIFKADTLKEVRLFNLPPSKWATVITRYFIRLGHDADIYLKSTPINIKLNTLNELEKFRGGETIDKARLERVPVLYPLKNIYTDLKAGADIEKRFLAFVTA